MPNRMLNSSDMQQQQEQQQPPKFSPTHQEKQHLLHHQLPRSPQPDDHSRRGSLAISALLNDVAVDPYRSPDSIPQRSEPPDYFSPLRSPTSGASPIMSSSVASSPGPPRHLERPKSWHKDTITPEGFHRRTNSNGDVIVSTIAKAKRKRISPDQFKRLMEVFEQTDTPSSEVRENLANELGMTKREVQVWFQNRRAKVNRTRAATAAPNNTSMRQSQQSFLVPQHQSQHMVHHQHHQVYHHHLTAPTQHSQPLVRRASANSILEPHRRLPPSRPTQPQPTLSYPPAIQQQQLQPIAPMPAQQQQQLPYIQIDESPTPGHKRQLAPPTSSQPLSSASSTTSSSSSDYFNYGQDSRGGNIHQSLANLSIQSNRNGGAGPVRKRARSRTSIDMLASAAEYVNSEQK